MPHKLIQDLKCRSRMLNIIIIIITAIDELTNCSLHILDAYFTIYDDDTSDFQYKMVYIILEITIFTSVILYIYYSIYRGKISRMLFVGLAYLIIGLLLFCFLLIKELRMFNDEGTNSNPSRPINFFEYHLDKVFITMNIFSCVIRIIGSACLMFLANNLKRIDDIIQSQLILQTENEESTCVKKDTAINCTQSRESKESSTSERDTKFSFTYKVPASDEFKISEHFEGKDQQRRSSMKEGFSSDLYYKQIIKD